MEIIICAAIVGGIGLILSIALVLASKFLAVKQDETFTEVRACLPGANCGACGYSGCDGYAQALASGQTDKTNLCVPGADAVSKALSDTLGTEFCDVIEQVAVVNCVGTCNVAKKPVELGGLQSCAAASLLPTSADGCAYGCLGLGDCAAVCPENAICLDNGIAHIDTRKCIGCGLCMRTCPRKVISLIADVEQTIVACSNKEKGAATRLKCTSGCIGCGKCERNCPTGAIKVVNNLAHINHDLCDGCDKCAAGCPVGCIIKSDFSGYHRFK